MKTPGITTRVILFAIIAIGLYLAVQNGLGTTLAPQPAPVAFETEYATLWNTFSDAGVNIQFFYRSESDKLFSKNDAQLLQLKDDITTFKTKATLNSSKNLAEIYENYIDFVIAQKKVDAKNKTLASFAINDECGPVPTQIEVHNLRASTIEPLLHYVEKINSFVTNYPTENATANIIVPTIDMKKMVDDYAEEATYLDETATKCGVTA